MSIVAETAIATKPYQCGEKDCRRKFKSEQARHNHCKAVHSQTTNNQPSGTSTQPTSANNSQPPGTGAQPTNTSHNPVGRGTHAEWLNGLPILHGVDSRELPQRTKNEIQIPKRRTSILSFREPFLPKIMQDGIRVFGAYECSSCHKKWLSPATLINRQTNTIFYGQQCKKCTSSGKDQRYHLPYKWREFQYPHNNNHDGKPHLEDLCGACKLGDCPIRDSLPRY